MVFNLFFCLILALFWSLSGLVLFFSGLVWSNKTSSVIVMNEVLLISFVLKEDFDKQCNEITPSKVGPSKKRHHLNHRITISKILRTYAKNSGLFIRDVCCANLHCYRKNYTS